MATIKIEGAAGVPFMPGFEPIDVLWDGAGAAYPSEFSARWAVRKMRDELVKAEAVAVHRNRTIVHPVRFAEVAQRTAIAEFSSRSQRR